MGFEMAFKLYRNRYIKDVEKFGEDYWKNKLLVEHGSLDKQEMSWEDVYDGTEVFHIFDTSTTIELARLIL